MAWFRSRKKQPAAADATVSRPSADPTPTAPPLEGTVRFERTDSSDGLIAYAVTRDTEEVRELLVDEVTGTPEEDELDPVLCEVWLAISAHRTSSDPDRHQLDRFPRAGEVRLGAYRFGAPRGVAGMRS